MTRGRPVEPVRIFLYTVRVELSRPEWIQSSRTIARLGEAVRKAPDVSELLDVQRGEPGAGPTVALETFAPEPVSAVSAAMLACSRAFEALEIEPAGVAALGLRRGV